MQQEGGGSGERQVDSQKVGGCFYLCFAMHLSVYYIAPSRSSHSPLLWLYLWLTLSLSLFPPFSLSLAASLLFLFYYL